MTVEIAKPAIWDVKSYIRPIETIAGGIRAWTHLAELRPPNEPPCRGYVKHFPVGYHRGLLNEWLGHIIMQALGVPQPRAALMQAPVMALEGAPLAWAFVSCQPVPRFEGTPAQIYSLNDPGQHKALVQRLFSCKALPLLIAADQVIKNADRHLGNLVFTGKQSIVAIDHSDILGGPTWAISEHWFTQVWAKSRLIEEIAPISTLKTSTIAAILACAELASERIFQIYPALYKALDACTNADVEAALQAIWWRALELRQWFQERLYLLT